jgi:hypothetical protein
MWDEKRCEGGVNPEDEIFKKYQHENYRCDSIVLTHPVFEIKRKDNYLRSVGIIMTTTKFITQIDDDCWIEEDWLEKAIECMIQNSFEYCFCKRYLWKDVDEPLGIDDYESIGKMNQFGYHLMETNSIVFTRKISFDISCITKQFNEESGASRKSR